MSQFQPAQPGCQVDRAGARACERMEQALALATLEGEAAHVGAADVPDVVVAADSAQTLLAAFMI